MKVKRFIISWAQDKTPVDPDFWACIRTFAKRHRAEVLVMAGTYVNPTSPHAADFEEAEGDDAYAFEVQPFLARERRALADNLTFFADVRIQPTASRPLTGFEVFTGGHSSIFGHPKRAFEVVPTATRMPRVQWTTGACTVPNYSRSKAGAKGQAHHVLGALIVEVHERAGDDRYWIRNVSFDRRTKSFTDLDRRYSVRGVEKAPPALSLTLGDIHVGQRSKDGRAEAAAEELFRLLSPQHLVLHDVLDFRYRNHHDRSFRGRYAGRRLSVATEVKAACDAVREFAEWGKGTHETHVVRSNHDEALERWLEEHIPREDLENAPYWHFLMHRQLEHFRRTKEWPDIFAMEFFRHHPEEFVHFLKRNERLRIGNVDGGFHGDKGANGARGCAGYVKLGVKVSVGHGHAPYIRDGVFGTGVYGSLDHGYNGLPSSWLNAHVSHLADGKRQMVCVIGGKYNG